MDRRTVLKGAVGCLSLGVTGGCSTIGDGNGSASTPTEVDAGSPTRTEAGPTPENSFPLEVVNYAQDPIPISIELTEVSFPDGSGSPTEVGSVYSESVELEPEETLDLDTHRNGMDLRFVVANAGEVLFEDVVEPFEGHRVVLRSASEADVESYIA